MAEIEPISVAIVVPVHNRLEYTREFLESLFANTYRNFVLFITDDGSTDGTSDYLRENWPPSRGVRVIQGDGSYWWTKSVNAAIRLAQRSGFTHVLTLNNDVVLPPDYLENILAAARAHPHAIIGSQSFDLKTRAWHSSGTRRNWLPARDEIIPRIREGEVVRTTHICARGTLVPMEVFETLGLYDEKHLPQYGADEELTFRAAGHGWQIVIPGNVTLYSHIEAAGWTGYMKSFSLRNLWNYLTSVRSPCNLKVHVIICYRHCRPGWYWAIAFAIDTARIIGGYFRQTVFGKGRAFTRLHETGVTANGRKSAQT